MPLSAKQLAHLERRLRNERTRALRLLNRSVEEDASASEEERAGDLSIRPTHPADIGTDTIDQGVDAANATRISEEVAEIDAALERLIKTPEKYGISEDTGEEIPFERLDIIPWARNRAEPNESSGPPR